MKPFWRQKSTWTGILGLAGLAAGVLTGELSAGEAVTALGGAISGGLFAVQGQLRK